MNELPSTPPVIASDSSDERNPKRSEARSIDSFGLASEPGNERVAMERVAAIAQAQGLDDEQIERLKTAVAEATLNALEHGNHYRPELEVHVEVLVAPEAITVRITDQGSGGPSGPPVAPDLDAKLAGEQSPRGWGLFLIQHMVDEMRVGGDDHHHTVELTIRRTPAG